jgi:anti-anti-sigma regulatory factor
VKEQKMAIQKIAENIVLVVLDPEPDMTDEFSAINEMVSTRCDFDIIMDFTRVEILTSPNISNLLILHNWLRGCGRKLILCHVALATKCIFNVAGLDTHFDFVDDKADALAILQPVQ